jgi:hypothetical protein
LIAFGVGANRTRICLRDVGADRAISDLVFDIHEGASESDDLFPLHLDYIEGKPVRRLPAYAGKLRKLFSKLFY